MTNFVDFDFDADCKMLYKFRIRSGFGLSQWKRTVIFAVKKTGFVNFLDFIWTSILNFLNPLDYG